MLSGIVEHHADDGYSKWGNFGSFLVHNIFLIYLPDGTNIYGQEVGSFRG